MTDSRKPIHESVEEVSVTRGASDPAATERRRLAQEQRDRKWTHKSIPAVLAESQISVPCPREEPLLDTGVGSASVRNSHVAGNVRVSTYVRRSGGGYIVFLRAADWGHGATLMRGGGGPGHSVADVQEGRVRYTLTYDRATNVLDINGSNISLDEGNVILVDRIDGVGGPPIVRRVGCVPLRSPNETWRRAIESIPEVKAFVFGDGSPERS